jgi:hypothetical protein
VISSAPKCLMKFRPALINGAERSRRVDFIMGIHAFPLSETSSSGVRSVLS